ncbi:hypothetical protein GCM10010168_29020 [Actinoplanes ianthinogenes]|uniref:Aminoglycoside phosphotransferase domain-containing protein n=2 Tax=Actinoplanes ianthinogenes TaxID=122358 RepID=A0ABM7LLE9_9ACTN|nr:hypothetical protein Aiant_07010 [Actinoplanes ianthinogenes]GGR09889.1 hypothetical protein GCM10010168_29020 [Actinoplanes ianthinogenes]
MNLNWRVTTDAGDFAVKRLTDRSPEAFRAAQDLLPRLAELGFPVPAPRRTAEGSALLKINGFRYGVSEWLPGAHPSGAALDPETCTALGDLVGRLHLALADLCPPAPARLLDVPASAEQTCADLKRYAGLAAARLAGIACPAAATADAAERAAHPPTGIGGTPARAAHPPTGIGGTPARAAQPPTGIAETATRAAQPPTGITDTATRAAQPPTGITDTAARAAQPPTGITDTATRAAQPPTGIAETATRTAHPPTGIAETAGRAASSLAGAPAETLIGAVSDHLPAQRSAQAAGVSRGAVDPGGVLEGSPRSSDDFDRLAGAEIGRRLALLERVGDQRPPASEVEPCGWTHGDLQPLNLLMDRGRVTGILDWDRLDVRPYGLEVLRTATILFSGGGRTALDLGRTACFVRGYRGRVPITGAQLVDAADRRWWTLACETWHLKRHYDEGDNRCDSLFTTRSTFLHWWTRHRADVRKILDS